MVRSRGTTLVVKDLEIDWRKARQLKEQVNRAVRNIVTEGGYELLDAANETVPRDEGDLEASGYVEVDSRGEVEVGYSAPYALRQHEVKMKHQGKGRWKWLELTAQERHAQRSIGDAMADETKKAMR